jgi:hypothetical protein
MRTVTVTSCGQRIQYATQGRPPAIASQQEGRSTRCRYLLATLSDAAGGVSSAVVMYLYTVPQLLRGDRSYSVGGAIGGAERGEGPGKAAISVGVGRSHHDWRQPAVFLVA